MMNMILPALFDVADAAATRQQTLFLRLVTAEYSALLVVSVLSINVLPASWYVILYGLVLASAMGVLLHRMIANPECRWYQARALAESVKTLAWKYAMRARPFDSPQASDLFRQTLRELVAANQQIGSQFDSEIGKGAPISSEMDALRALAPQERLSFYMTQRVEDQRSWYLRSARRKKSAARLSAFCLAGLYVAAFAVLLVRVSQPSWTYAHPDPIILVAASMLGWMQIKRFNELSASYNLTAFEIGLLAQPAASADDAAVSLFVDDAEEAFSREHTQWLARRSV